jgi:hypothetical protein
MNGKVLIKTKKRQAKGRFGGKITKSLNDYFRPPSLRKPHITWQMTIPE